MQINYKYTTWVLLALIIIMLVFPWVCGRGGYRGGHKRWQDGERMYMQDQSQPMHQMPGKMHMSSAASMWKPMSMDHMMMSMTANLQGKTGKALEQAFITDMIPHHQGAVDMSRVLLADPNISPELKVFAQNIISAQESEISLMKEWLKSY